MSSENSLESLRQQLADRDKQISDLTISSDTYFAERNSARDVWRRASKDRDELRQKLAEMTKQRDAFHDLSLGEHGDAYQAIQEELASALVAIKAKDEALERIRGHLNLYNLFSCVGSDSYDPECADLNAGKCREIAIEALAATSDQSLEQFAAKRKELP